jgi:hypothetical protein
LNVIDERAEGHHDASALMSANEGKLGCQRPISIYRVKICVANTRVFDVDENLIWTWLLNWNLLINES